MEAVVELLYKVIPLVCATVIVVYLLSSLKGRKKSKAPLIRDYTKEQEKLNKMRKVRLTKPLTEATRPSSFEEIIGQEKGLLGLKAALCGANPQHVIIYGQPGIGKTAAARTALDVAKSAYKSPFTNDAKFVEIDATTLRFDERGVADPLIGAVHDPIYQGAGAYGNAGIPQPKMGAVTKAHGGILFIDEIGELHSAQMNKLLKVLEDRKVFLESSYYAADNHNIPSHIHDMFRNGLPADFRLVGATTRHPSEIPPALRSRCMEIFFDPLGEEDIKKIAINAANKAKLELGGGVIDLLMKYAHNGREAVNIIQTGASIADLDNRKNLTLADIEWVLETGQYIPRLSQKIRPGLRVGVVSGLAVSGFGAGSVLGVEVLIKAAAAKDASLKITGIVEEEELNNRNGTSKRISMARGSVDNVLTLFERLVGISHKDYTIHINYPGGALVDGPSAGIAVFTALYSAFYNKPIPSEIAMSGEVSMLGRVYPVGGVSAKIAGAKAAGIKKVIIPKENNQSSFSGLGIEIIPVSTIEEVLELVFPSQSNDLRVRATEIINA